MNDEDIAVKSLATAFQFGVALGFAKKYDEMHEVVEEVKKAIISERESCEDAVSRGDVLDAIARIGLLKNETKEIQSVSECLREVEKLPPVTPQPKGGYWIDADGDNAICSCCNRLNHLYGTYCKHCGAKMEVEGGING